MQPYTSLDDCCCWIPVYEIFENWLKNAKGSLRTLKTFSLQKQEMNSFASPMRIALISTKLASKMRFWRNTV